MNTHLPATARLAWPLAALVVLVGLTGCMAFGTYSSETTMGVDEIAIMTLKDTPLTLIFLRVEDDSRCPADAECARAGEATVVIQAETDDGIEEISMFAGRDKAGSVKLGVYTITLEGLLPDPPSQGGVEQSEYQASFRVTRR